MIIESKKISCQIMWQFVSHIKQFVFQSEVNENILSEQIKNYPGKYKTIQYVTTLLWNL